MKTRNLTNVRGLVVLFSLIAMLYVTGCSEDITTVLTSSNNDSITSNDEKDAVGDDIEFEPILIHYDGSWHILYRKPYGFYDIYASDHTYIGYLSIWTHSSGSGAMRLEFKDYSYVMVDSIETIETFKLSQQQEGTDADWEALGLTNPNNPE